MTESGSGKRDPASIWRSIAPIGVRFAPYIIGFLAGALIGLVTHADRFIVAYAFIAGGVCQILAERWWRRQGRRRR